MRIETSEVTLKTRKGLDWTGKYPAIADSAAVLPDAIIDGVPDFAALQAALSEGKTHAMVYFAFDLLFEGNEDLREIQLTKRKERLQKLLEYAGENPRLGFVEQSRQVAMRSSDQLAGCRSKELVRNR
ncbi:hypothetical protein ABFT80_23140 [Mesorhizobium sp. SB112]|uniref:hypothetical protein n=1 Tax=Mesorhizobium sp. SB112 TaxID=3151853 RepID=UPI003266BACD